MLGEEYGSPKQIPRGTEYARGEKIRKKRDVDDG